MPFCKLSICLAGLLMGLCLACSDTDDSVSGTGDEQTESSFEDWVLFDSTVFFARSPSSCTGESYYDGESIIGEPFTDVNGNGVYDEGIDIFIRSVDSTNQDLNDDGKYTGPNDTWEPGIPFDDLNGDDWYNPLNTRYDVGDLFCDFNGDGVRDDGCDYIVRWIPVDTTGNSTTWQYEFRDSVGQFVSDSGVYYAVPGRSYNTWDYTNDRPLRDPLFEFVHGDTGLDLSYNKPGHRTILHLLDTGRVTIGSERIVIPGGCIDLGNDSISFLRSVSEGEQLEIAGITFTDLLCIRYDDAWIDNDSMQPCTYEIWEFYFAKDHGIMSITCPYGYGQWSVGFPVMYDSLPLPLIQ